MLASYSSPYTIGHKALDGLWDGTVYVSEKIDGSQFSFGLDSDGTLQMRSRNVAIHDGANSMFDAAVKHVKSVKGKLMAGWTYRCEYLRVPKHNTLAYGRIPKNHLMLLDIDMGNNMYVQDYMVLALHADLLGIEAVPLMGVYRGQPPLADLQAYLTIESVLGNVPVEGIVLKNYDMFGPDKKVLMGKLVRDDFKETHKVEWRKSNPTQKDIVARIIDTFATEQRWAKAVQHLREADAIQGMPEDIPVIMKEIVLDVRDEHADDIRAMLFDHFWKDIQRGLTRGMPVWYKGQLAKETELVETE